MTTNTHAAPLSDEERARVAAEVARVPSDLKARFDAAFEAWQKSWFRGRMAFNSDTRHRAAGPEFDALVALGDAILPLVVEKMHDPDNFIALVLYDRLQKDEKLRVRYAPRDPQAHEGEHARALRTARAWLARP